MFRRGANGDTALHVALNNKDECVPEAILDHAENIDFHIKNREGESPLLFAASHSTENIVKKIISKNVKVDKYCLHKAVVNDYTGAGLRTAKNDIYIHDYNYFNDTDDRINNSEDTQCRVVNLFIRLGLDINIIDKNGNTPLLYAVE
ncbi:ankyrin repeat domain-containing protein [Wolbachia endosymbiont (group E) of Neria commutata]|uniref:ankyrin repeat domain-containing protein n=1 Tax=Wolbachia endosymbiont (group E) of Neria commutata TaxID=3066149 RepID=UPI003132A76C